MHPVGCDDRDVHRHAGIFLGMLRCVANQIRQRPLEQWDIKASRYVS